MLTGSRLWIFFVLVIWKGGAQNIRPAVSENDFVADLRSNLAVSEKQLRKIPSDTLSVNIELQIDEAGNVYDGQVLDDVYGFDPLIKRALGNLPVFEVPPQGAPFRYSFKMQYPNPYFRDGGILEPSYPLKGGVKRLYDDFAGQMDKYFRLENIGDFTLVYFVDKDGVVRDFIYEEPVSKALNNYTKRFFKKIATFEPAYKEGVPIRYKMSFTFTIIDN